jgi:hypothetical protein
MKNWNFFPGELATFFKILTLPVIKNLDPRPDWIGIEKVCKDFKFLSHFIQMPLILLLIRHMGCCTQTEIFSAKPVSKNARKSTIVLKITAREKNI